MGLDGTRIDLRRDTAHRHDIHTARSFSAKGAFCSTSIIGRPSRLRTAVFQNFLYYAGASLSDGSSSSSIFGWDIVLGPWLTSVARRQMGAGRASPAGEETATALVRAGVLVTLLPVSR